jgi:hypothetical protein
VLDCAVEGVVRALVDGREWIILLFTEFADLGDLDVLASPSCRYMGGFDVPSQAMKLLTPHLSNLPSLYNSFTARSVSKMETERSGPWRYHKSTFSVPSALRLSVRPVCISSGVRWVTGRPIQPKWFGKNFVSMVRPRDFQSREARYSSEEPPCSVVSRRIW